MVSEYSDRSNHWNKLFCPQRSLGTPSLPTPDLVYQKQWFVKAVGANIRQLSNLDKWISIATITHMPLEEYLNLDEFWQEAVFGAVQEYIEAQNKEQKKSFEDMTKRIEDLKPHSSPLNNIAKPSFHLS